MSLFKITDLKRQEPAVKSKAITFEGKTSAVICKKNQKLQAVMYMPPDKGAVQFVSLGDWSTHDLLFYYLNITGPADVYFTTWSISEFAMRQLYAMVDSKLITSLSGLFDYRNGIHKPAELQFLKQITTDICPAKCHAKVVVILNDNFGISIVTSGNFTRNPRIEAGTVTNDREIALFNKQWIVDEITNNSQFEKD